MVTREDLAAKDPLRVVVQGGSILDVSLANVTRDVCGIELGQSERSGDQTTAKLSLDFLDHHDGALIQVVTDSHKSTVSLIGTVIGMPRGIKQLKETDRDAMVSGWGCLPAGLLQVGALVAVPLLYRHLAGTWDDAWLLLLPVGALVLPAVITTMVGAALNPLRTLHFPKMLTEPSWYIGRARAYGIRPPGQGSFARDK